MAHRGATRAIALVVGLAVIGLAPPAAGADPAVPPPVGPVRIPVPSSNDYFTELHITDGAVYTVTGFWDGVSAHDITRVYRNTLHAGPSGPVLGNTRFLDFVTTAHDQGGSVAARPAGMVWTSESYDGAIVAQDDDGTMTNLGGNMQVPVGSCTSTWCTAGDALVAIPDGRALDGLLLGRAQDDADLPWAPVATDRYMWSAEVTDTHVFWIETLWPEDDSNHGRRLYANAIDADGFVGAPVLLAEGFDADGQSGPYGLEASQAVVAWNEFGDTSDVRWLALADLGAVPQERIVPGQVWDIAVDDSRIAVAHAVGEVSREGTNGVDVLDAATGAVLHTIGTPQGALLVDLHDDVLAWLDLYSSGAREIRLISVDPAAPLTALPDFPDVAAWNGFVPEIDQLALRGITTGYADGTFRPWDSVNRDAMAAFLYRLAGQPAFTPPATATFADVPRSHPFYLEISWLAEQGITTGWELADGTVEFRPGEPVSREATAAFLYRTAGRPAYTPPATSPFEDVSTGEQFYREIAWLAAMGIAEGWDLGDGRTWFGPSWEIERQAMAAFLIRFDDLGL